MSNESLYEPGGEGVPDGKLPWSLLRNSVTPFKGPSMAEGLGSVSMEAL